MEQLQSSLRPFRRWVVAVGVAAAALSIAGTAQAQERGPYPPPYGWERHHRGPPPGYWHHRPPPPGYYYGAPPVVVAPPPPVYYAPPPPVVYSAPGLNIVIPIR
ncbi:hypothetical protein [Telmatospirillum siberiense]|uniref:Uncharacterized protein n=1 Tax=Telmatospirillum siberiense TaxID=382514 RepID=A0A2N3PR64_9PROT|nr:hypothetical protein [Telmatospirillum siberiense]PKU22893.1 hypothetical protein CWS72_19790 [Telmatospirillum siberiense]